MDRIIRATAADGSIKMAVINARDIVQRAHEIHGSSPPPLRPWAGASAPPPSWEI